MCKRQNGVERIRENEKNVYSMCTFESIFSRDHSSGISNWEFLLQTCRVSAVGSPLRKCFSVKYSGQSYDPQLTLPIKSASFMTGKCRWDWEGTEVTEQFFMAYRCVQIECKVNFRESTFCIKRKNVNTCRLVLSSMNWGMFLYTCTSWVIIPVLYDCHVTCIVPERALQVHVGLAAEESVWFTRRRTGDDSVLRWLWGFQQMAKRRELSRAMFVVLAKGEFDNWVVVGHDWFSHHQVKKVWWAVC